MYVQTQMLLSHVQMEEGQGRVLTRPVIVHACAAPGVGVVHTNGAVLTRLPISSCELGPTVITRLQNRYIRLPITIMYATNHCQ